MKCLLRGESFLRGFSDLPAGASRSGKMLSDIYFRPEFFSLPPRPVRAGARAESFIYRCGGGLEIQVNLITPSAEALAIVVSTLGGACSLADRQAVCLPSRCLTPSVEFRMPRAHFGISKARFPRAWVHSARSAHIRKQVKRGRQTRKRRVIQYVSLTCPCFVRAFSGYTPGFRS